MFWDLLNVPNVLLKFRTENALKRQSLLFVTDVQLHQLCHDPQRTWAWDGAAAGADWLPAEARHQSDGERRHRYHQQPRSATLLQPLRLYSDNDFTSVTRLLFHRHSQSWKRAARGKAEGFTQGAVQGWRGVDNQVSITCIINKTCCWSKPSSPVCGDLFGHLFVYFIMAV